MSSNPGVVYAIKNCSKQGESRQAYVPVSILILLPFAQFIVGFSEGQLIIFYLWNRNCRNLLTSGKTAIVSKPN